ncbi:ROK family protein [Exiguobacterium sp. s150]|uniref:ROK family transcriptional regulator n=1 Tax=Exiguobacterium sp. s150 TaxID=2751221 RepID=UPI001BE75EFE|nr:ROK family protein [Exiguobacterium sp. s150]
MKGKATPLSVAIRRQLVFHDHHTVAEISEAIGHSFPTVKKHLELMRAAGEVNEQGLTPSTGGRPATRYVFNPSAANGLCAYIEQDVIAYRRIDAIGTTLDKGRMAIRHGNHLQTLFDLLASQLASHSIQAVTIGVAAAVADGEIIYAPDYPTLSNVALTTLLESTFDVPVVVENDMNAAVYGYGRSVPTYADETIVYVYLGKNGPGSGILLNGRLIRGKTNFTGEISFLPFYAHHTFYDRIRNHQRGTPLTDQACDALARLITTFTATLNPHTIVFSDIDVTEEDIRRVRKRSERYIAATHLPDLTRGLWEEHYFQGLITFCVETLLETI